MAEKRPADEPVVFAALLRAARFAYGATIREALNEAGLDDIPKNGIFVIGAISRTGAPLAQIIDSLGVSKQSAGQLVDTLALRGYIERDVDPDDRRRLTVALTARGREAAAISRAAVERIDAALLKKVGREHVAHTRATLTALIALTRGKDSPMSPALAVAALWLGFAASWIIAMVWSSRVEKRIGIGREIAYRVVLIIGGVLGAIPAHGYNGDLRLWYLPYRAVWPTVGLIVLGFAFSWWARIWLGALWSGQVTVKADHRVVDTGPYRIVRHPIYTGILLAVYATMTLKGTILGLAAGAIITLGLWMKARLEEDFLREELGPGYDAYRARVPMLMPLGPKDS